MVPLVKAGLVGAEISSNLARFRGFPEMLMTSCFPWCRKSPKTAQKTPFLTRNGTPWAPQSKPEVAPNTRKPLYTTNI